MNKNKKSSRQVKKNMLYYESKQTANIATFELFNFSIFSFPINNSVLEN